MSSSISSSNSGSDNEDLLDRSVRHEHERMAARQRKLDMMEAAASGQAYDDGNISISSAFSSQNTGPEGAMESARRFLWEDEDAQNMPSAIAYDHGDAAGLVKRSAESGGAGGLGSRMANTIMGSLLFTNRGDDEDDKYSASNIAAASFHLDAQPRDADEYIPHKRKSVGGLCADCGMATYHTGIGVVAIFCEGLMGCLASVSMMDPRKCGAILFLLFAVGLLIFGIVAGVNSSGGGNSRNKAASDNDYLPPIQNQKRYNELRKTILASSFTSAEDLDAPGMAQNYALRWLTDDDERQEDVDNNFLVSRFALATFYFSTYVYSEVMHHGGGEENVMTGWTHMEGWMSESTICDWYGVSCKTFGDVELADNAEEHIFKLNLTSNNMRGLLPSELVALEHLETLDLGKNQLSGTIPKSFGRFTALTELFLEDNLLTGSLPDELGSVSSLRDFYLGTNRLVGTIPSELSSLTELRAIGLDENLLTGTIPDIFYSSFANLMILYLDANHLEGTISRDIQKLRQLVDLRLRQNAFTGSLPTTLHDLTHLELLYIDDNKLTGTIPPRWDSMQRLQELQLYKNVLTGTLPDQIHMVNTLRVLYLDENFLEGTLPASYGSLSDLRVLYLSNNKFKGSLPTEIGQMVNLVDVQLFHNQFTGQLPTELGNCPELFKFEAHDNGLSGTIPSEYGQLEKLEMLKLYRNDLTGSVPTEVCNAKDDHDLGFVATDCNKEEMTCDCCNACYPSNY